MEARIEKRRSSRERFVPSGVVFLLVFKFFGEAVWLCKSFILARLVQSKQAVQHQQPAESGVSSGLFWQIPVPLGGGHRFVSHSKCFTVISSPLEYSVCEYTAHGFHLQQLKKDKCRV